VAVKALKALIDESEQAAKSQRLLENAVKLSGGSIGRMTDEVERLSKQFGIGDEKAAPFVAAVNKLVQAVGRPEDLEKFSAALLDIGAARSTGVEDVASAVEAATRGMTRGLEQLLGMDVDGYGEIRQVVGRHQGQTKVGRQTAIYNLINEQAVKVQGAAAAAGIGASTPSCWNDQRWRRNWVRRADVELRVTEIRWQRRKTVQNPDRAVTRSLIC
jgi:hypothetical protein